jgi:hypothetical protein
MIVKPSVFADPDNLPGVVLHNPYAGAVWLHGLGYEGKDIESRKRRILYRGDIVICAGNRIDRDAYDRVRGLLTVARDADKRIPDGLFKIVTTYHPGKATAVATVTDCRPLVAEDYTRVLWWDAAENARKPRWAWVLSNVRALHPFEVHGHQGFMRIPRDKVLKAVIEPWERDEIRRRWAA